MLLTRLHRAFSPEVEHALKGVQFIAQHIRDNDKDNEVTSNEWCRLQLIVF